MSRKHHSCPEFGCHGEMWEWEEDTNDRLYCNLCASYWKYMGEYNAGNACVQHWEPSYKYDGSPFDEM